jgi:diguanylate cyclase (GGDEF)-like protein
MSSKLYHIIFVDDDKDFLHSMNMAISPDQLEASDGIEVELHFVSDPEKGLSFIQELLEEQEKIAVVISDQQMPQMTGIELMEKINIIDSKSLKILLTGYASLDSAKYAINNKILDQYVSKPIEDNDNFISLIMNSIRTYHFRDEKERADEEIKQYVHELEVSNARIKSMHNAAEKIAYLAQGFRKLDLDEVFDLIIARLPSIFNAKYSSLFLLDEEDNSLKMVRSNYLGENYEKRLNIDDQSPMVVAMRQNKTIVLPEIQQVDLAFLHKECLGNSCIIIPFVLGGDQNSSDILGSTEGIKGVLNLGNITDMETEEIVKYAASLIRNILGINILNARLYQKTQRLALIDGLTGLYNKHIFTEFLRKECDYSERHGLQFFLALFDADDFKAINDTYGHRIGDEVLAQLGLLLKSAARKSDILARFGGEEFAWIIHRGEIEDIIAVIERFREEVENSEFPGSVRMSISVGLSRYTPESGDSIDKLIDRADKAMYQSKTTGKNRVEVSFSDGNN